MTQYQESIDKYGDLKWCALSQFTSTWVGCAYKVSLHMYTYNNLD